MVVEHDGVCARLVRCHDNSMSTDPARLLRRGLSMRYEKVLRKVLHSGVPKDSEGVMVDEIGHWWFGWGIFDLLHYDLVVAGC